MVPKIIKVIYQAIVIFLFTVAMSQEIEPEITMERKKLIILTSEYQDSDISQKIIQIASSTATKLNRYHIIDRSQLDKILKEQKLQHSGVVDQDQAIEIGKLAAANEALFIQINNFGQKGVPTDKQKEKEEEDEPDTGLFGWVVKEVVKAEIDKEMENVERYPNNIQTIIDGEIRLVDLESGQSVSSFTIHVDHTGGVKTKSLSAALKQVRSQMVSNLKSMYKLSSEVLDIRGNNVTLLLGRKMGVKSGTLFEIITREEKRVVRDREITIPGKSVGIVEVKAVSSDANKGWILRKWDDIEPGYQAHEIIEGVSTGGITGIYGFTPANIRLCLFGNIKPFNHIGGAVYGNIGTVKDTRDNSNFLLGFGFDLNYRLIRTSPFSLGGVISLPFDFHFRSDDPNPNFDNKSHTVFLSVFSPRVGIQSEIMLSPKIDLVIRGEYVLTSANMGAWTYTEEQKAEDETDTWNAYWNEIEKGPKPKIDYQGWLFSVAIRSIFFSNFMFE